MRLRERERMTTTLSVRGQLVPQYTYDLLRGVIIELFCVPKSSLGNPSIRGSGRAPRTFCILEEGEMDGINGAWVEDDDSGEQGFVDYAADTLWSCVDNEQWASDLLAGRRTFRRGNRKGSRKGGKGKGAKGRSRFRPWKKGQGRGRNNLADGDQQNWDQPDTYYQDWDSYYGKRKGKPKGGKSHFGKGGFTPSWKGKGKGKGKWTDALSLIHI